MNKYKNVKVGEKLYYGKKIGLNKWDNIYEEYRKVALEIKHNWQVEDWLMKKTVTKDVLNPGRKQEQKVLDAIQNIDYSEGDKVYLFCKDKDTLQLKHEFENIGIKTTGLS